MERINLDNYEAYFLDYQEGSLSAQQEFELMDFLDRNPELKNDLEADFADVKLQPAAISFDKGSLKKEGIQADEIDNLMIASVEGQLSVGENAELKSYVDQNNLGTSYKYYQNTIVHPDLSVGYGNTSDLKKKDRFLIPFWMKATAVTGGLALIIALSYNQFNSDEPVESMATTIVDAEHELEHNIADNNQIETNIDNHEPAHLGSNEENFVEVNNSSENDNSFIEPINETLIDDSENEINNSLIDDVSPDQNELETEIESLKSENSIDSSKTDLEIKEKEKLIEPEEKIDSREEYEKKKNNIISEEPIKPVTDFAGKIFKRDISYERKKDTGSGDYVGHHVKLGKFEFQRKK